MQPSLLWSSFGSPETKSGYSNPSSLQQCTVRGLFVAIFWAFLSKLMCHNNKLWCSFLILTVSRGLHCFPQRTSVTVTSLTLHLLAHNTMALQVDEQQSPSEVGYDIEEPPDSSPKKNKKKRDAATLRKAPQGTLFAHVIAQSWCSWICKLNSLVYI